MAFTILQKGHTISATEFNDNFYFVAQGDLLPRTGSSLTAVDGSNDLGSSSYEWDNVYCQQVNLSNEIESFMNLVSEVNLTTTASSIEITGLTSLEEEKYNMIFNIKGYATQTVHLYFNGDSNTSNYGMMYLRARGASILTNTLQSSNGINITSILNDTTAAVYTKANVSINAKSSFRITNNTSSRDVGNGYIREHSIFGQIWNDTTTITTMKITGYFDPGTNIQLWEQK